MNRYHFQLQDRMLGGFAGPSITTAGGKAIVTAAGAQAKATLYNKDGTALANPISLTRGAGEFYTATSVGSVDLFIFTGDGQSTQLWAVKPDALHEVPVDRGDRNQVLVFPISVADQVTDNTAVLTLIAEPSNVVFTSRVAVKVVTIDATETLDVGDSGDADGLISVLALDTAGVVLDTNGAYVNLGASFVSLGLNFQWTLSAGADTFTGYVFLPYIIMNTGQPTI